MLVVKHLSQNPEMKALKSTLSALFRHRYMIIDSASLFHLVQDTIEQGQQDDDQHANVSFLLEVSFIA